MSKNDIITCEWCPNPKRCGGGFIASGYLIRKVALDTNIDDSFETEAKTLLIASEYEAELSTHRVLQPECSLSDEQITYNIASTQD